MTGLIFFCLKSLMGQNKRLSLCLTYNLFILAFAPRPLTTSWPARKVQWEFLLSQECWTVGSGDDDGRGGGNRLQRRALRFAMHVKQDATMGQRMTGAGAGRNAFLSFVCVYF